MGSELLVGADIRVVRSGRPILEDVSITVGEGDRALIQGPSGAGKTTLFHVLGLLEPFTSGRLEFDGVDVTALSERQRSRIRRDDIGVVFQDFRLVPDLTAWENACLPQHHAESDEPWMESLFDRLGLDSLREQYPATLSGGEKQRVAIARALANRPRLVLVDEPTGQLDSTTSERVVDLLFAVQAASGTSLLCISHDDQFVERFPRAYSLRDGTLEPVTPEGDAVPKRG